MSSMNELYYGWIIFWTCYFGIGSLFPNDNGITRESHKLTQTKLLSKLVINCLVTALFVPIISQIPQIYYPGSLWYHYLIKYAMFLLIVDIWFYYTHRLMHSSYLYKWHSDHHAFIRPYALAGLYCSPLEMMFVNQLSVVIPFQLLGFSFNEVILFSLLVPLNVLKGHAGLHERSDVPKWIPHFLVESSEHDSHHATLTCNYGIFYLLDRLHGTYKNPI